MLDKQTREAANRPGNQLTRKGKLKSFIVMGFFSLQSTSDLNPGFLF